MLSTRRDLFTLAGAGASWMSGCSSKWSALSQRITQLMAELHVPGTSISIIRDGRIAWSMGFGVKDQTTRDPIDEGTVFEAQSMSKPVFAYRIMKLAEQGVLDLDAPLTKYTPDRFLEGEPRLHAITARHALSHTTGLPNWRSKAEPLRIRFTPGERWSYSGEGFYYLQSVITRLLGHTDPKTCAKYELDYQVCASNFGDYMTANLLQPFGMTSSAYVWTPAIGRRMATAHDKNGQPAPRPKSKAVDVARYGSAGALLTTANDYAKFLLEIINPKPADAYRLNDASLEAMLRPQVQLTGTPIKMSWALGWQIWHFEKGPLHAHGGDVAGYHSQSAFSVNRKNGFVVMTNGDNGAELISKHLLKDLIDNFT